MNILRFAPDSPMHTQQALPATGHRRLAIILFTLLIATWAFELLIIQDATTHPDDSLPVSLILKYAARRMVLNVAVCTLLVCVLNRIWLYGLFLVGMAFSTVIITYASYFHRPLSWLTLSDQWEEGVSVAGYGFALIPWSAILLLSIVLGLKVALREAIHRQPFPTNLRRKAAAVAGLVYLVSAVGFAGFYKPISRVNTGSPEYTYGYAVAWAAEYLSYDTEAVLADAIAKSAIKSHTLTEKERLLEFGDNIVVLQVESLDFDTLDAKVGDQYVMPFLHALKRQSMVYMVKPFHFTGSSEADFSLLATSTPNGRITPFKVQGFPYSDSLPWLVEKLGFTAVAIHGNTGAFFQRRAAYQQMGFSELYFVKELEELGVCGAEDDEVLQFSARLLNESDQPMFHFIITLTSHGPFDQLPPDCDKLFPSPRGIRHRYLNSMRYVDRSLEKYYQKLPNGTTLVIYGDHHSRVQGYQSGDVHEDRVPWLICQKGRNLAKRQKTLRTGLATSGSLSQLDMVCYLRDSLEATALVARRTSAKKSHLR